MDENNPNPPPKRTRRFLGVARKRAAPVQEVHLIHGTGHVEWHSDQGQVPKDIARFEKMNLVLENPAEKVTDADLVGFEKTGWNVRGYSPDEYAESGKGVEHEKAFSLAHRDELISYYRKHEEGEFHSSAESSGEDRGYLQEIWKNPKTGEVKRRQVPWETLLRFA